MHGIQHDGDTQVEECLSHLGMGSCLLQEWAGSKGWPEANGGERQVGTEL